MAENTLTTCESCGVAPRPMDTTRFGSAKGSYRLLCGRCFNLEVASRAGLVDFKHIDFEPLTMADSGGREHVFQFRTRLFGAGVSIDAIEFNEDELDGYRFQVIGDEEGDLFELFGRLVTKMRRGLALSHLEETEYGLRISDPGVVRGRIESELEADTDAPVVVIDGRIISWEEFGRMVATYMGFEFKLELNELSDDI